MGVNFEQLTEVLDEALTLYQAAITEHGVKDLAGELKKSKTTIYAEMSLPNLHTYIEAIQEYDDLNKKPTYLPKLGVVDFIIGMILSGDTRPLEVINRLFNMACFEIPRPDADQDCILSLLREINREHFENGDEVMKRIADGDLCKDDRKAISKESWDLINATATLKWFVDKKPEE